MFRYFPLGLILLAAPAFAQQAPPTFQQQIDSIAGDATVQITHLRDAAIQLQAQLVDVTKERDALKAAAPKPGGAPQVEPKPPEQTKP